MKVKQVMLENPYTLRQESTLNDAIEIYKKANVNCAPVMDGKRIVGILTIFRVLDALKQGESFASPVFQIMNTNLQFIDEDASFSEVSDKPIDRLIIVNKNQELTGVLTRIDLIKKVHQALETTEGELAEITIVNKRLHNIIEAFYDGILVLDHTGLIQMVNSNFFKVINSSHNPTGLLIKTLEIEEKNYIYDVYQQVVNEKKAISSFFKSPSQKEMVISGTPLFNDQGNITLVIICIRDLTEFNKLKLQTATAVEELKSLRIKEQSQLIYRSENMERVIHEALRIASVNSTVLITGESGVGKEVIARLIHQNGTRANQPFIHVNCGAIPDNLLESELFGYERGAFTGANKEGKPGLMELANKGTLLLDEIGDLPLNLQVKLLRVLQDHEVIRIGGSSTIRLDVRVLAATNRNLEQMVEENKFRNDLFYRLNVVPIHIPPLRERKEDILPLVIHFLNHFNQKHNLNRHLSSNVLHALEAYNWPGNIRELTNVMERIVIMSDSDLIDVNQLPPSFCRETLPGLPNLSLNEFPTLNEAVAKVEIELISRVLKEYNSLRSAAAVLGISHSTLLRKARALGITIKKELMVQN